ncbi:MAG: NADH:ubiquinone reductase (Na(+)-transporting) subunit F, partial [Bacteroidia bacterium]
MILATSTIGIIGISIIVFLAVLLLLVVLLLYARQKLVPSGDVTLKINDREMVISTGSNVMATLSNNGIFLPSACGGGGTCGQCKCQIDEGGGSILPTETGFFTRKEQQANWRLGCQVKVREDMTIRIPEAVLGVKKWECEVISNRNVATFIKEFVVRLPEGENLDFVSGGYIQVDVPKYDISFRDMDIEPQFRDEWDKFNMWDLRTKNTEETIRAYSMASYPAEGNIIKLNIRIATPP